MDKMFGFLLLSILITCASGDCFDSSLHGKIAYECNGGLIADLENVPQNTEYLRINDMNITKITSDTFSRFKSTLSSLNCYKCQISDIEPNSFNKLSRLEQLYLESNLLSSVKASWTSGLPKIFILDLSSNKIEDFEDAAFAHLGEVTDLRLSGNLLKCLNVKEMSKMIKLNKVDLRKNPNFKCPNAVRTFLQNQNITLEEDETWNHLEDKVQPTRDGANAWISMTTQKPIKKLIATVSNTSLEDIPAALEKAEFSRDSKNSSSTNTVFRKVFLLPVTFLVFRNFFAENL